MTKRFDDQIAIIIGTAKGIGSAIAHRFVEEGATVVLGDLDVEGGMRLAAALGPKAVFHPVDIAKESEVESIADFARERFGRIDVLVQNAGIYPPALIEDLTLDQWNRVIGVNLTGSFLATRACLPVMRARKKGRIVLMSSITGPRVSNPGVAAYAASKAGINGFIKTAALEFAPHGITINGIEPGNIMTEGLTTGRSPEFIAGMIASIPLGRIGMPADVANAAVFLASDEAAFVTGTTLIVDGGQILPEATDSGSKTAWR
jgi:3-oxoacyl-[acyl-carrier protein] reductase